MRRALVGQGLGLRAGNHGKTLRANLHSAPTFLLSTHTSAHTIPPGYIRARLVFLAASQVEQSQVTINAHTLAAGINPWTGLPRSPGVEL